MLVRAQHIRQVIHERTEVRRSEPINRQYRLVIRLGMLLSAVPLTLVLFMCVLHVPFVPVLGLFLVLWVVLKASDSMTELAFRWVWPLHSRLLLYRDPERTDTCVRRRVETRHHPGFIDFDPEGARLLIDAHAVDLATPYTLQLERAEGDDQTPQLRLRFFQGEAAWVIGAQLSEAQRQAWATELEQLPRREGDVYLMDFGALRALLTELHPLHASTGAPWPSLLRQVEAWDDDAPPTWRLTTRRAPARRLSTTAAPVPEPSPARKR